jgi:ribokinase
VVELLRRACIAHRPVIVPDQAADWTLLVTSGPHGDKLPIGFRGCHAKAGPGMVARAVECSATRPALVVAAGQDNRTALGVLRAFPDAIRLLAPSIRGMASRADPPGGLDGSVDVLACNREEWLAATPADRKTLEACLSLLSVTDGPRGATVQYRGGRGAWDEVRVPAFPRRHPPVDTNRAGEAFASTLVATLAAEGWRPGAALDAVDVRRAAIRASAASALELDLERFGFPTPQAIDVAVRVGFVGGDDRAGFEIATGGANRP